MSDLLGQTPAKISTQATQASTQELTQAHRAIRDDPAVEYDATIDDRAGTHVSGSAPSDLAARPVFPPAEPHGVLHAVQSLLYIIIVATFIITFTVQPFRIPSESMEPTLMVGDFLLVAKQHITTLPDDGAGWVFPSTAIHRGDVIVFRYPIDPSLHLVKRVVGMPGDRLRLRNGRVFIDGRQLAEPYAVYRDSPGDSFRDNFPRLENPDPDVTSNWWIQMKSLVYHGDLKVPPQSYFVLGDNRNDSEDSRYWGFVPASAIVGKPLLIYFSLNEASRDDTDSDTDSPPVARASAAPIQKPRQTTMLNEIADFARWDRTLRVVR